MSSRSRTGELQFTSVARSCFVGRNLHWRAWRGMIALRVQHGTWQRYLGWVEDGDVLEGFQRTGYFYHIHARDFRSGDPAKRGFASINVEMFLRREGEIRA